jgi:hypothetical protein
MKRAWHVSSGVGSGGAGRAGTRARGRRLQALLDAAGAGLDGI